MLKPGMVVWVKPAYGTKTIKGKVTGVSDSIIDVAVPGRLLPLKFKPADTPPYSSIVGDYVITKEEE